MRYDIQEGAFEVPSDLRADRSIQILELGEGDALKAVVIAREITDVAPDAFLEAFVGAHCARKPRFKLLSSEPTELAGLQAHEATYSWVQDKVAMTTSLVACRMGEKMLTLSVTGHAGDATATSALSRRISSTFRCRRPE